jgi:hypothetical protein
MTGAVGEPVAVAGAVLGTGVHADNINMIKRVLMSRFRFRSIFAP